ncbi:hypothetical protein CCP2SC5_1860006 [Azospirillaceae bacterium]
MAHLTQNFQFVAVASSEVTDWSPEFIRACVTSRGMTLQQLSVANGLPHYACKNACHRAALKAWAGREGIETGV